MEWKPFEKVYRSGQRSGDEDAGRQEEKLVIRLRSRCFCVFFTQFLMLHALKTH